jgi:hypothetical protein
MTKTAKLSANTVDVVPDVEATVEAEYPAPILITEHEVAFATAAAVQVPSSARWWTRAIHAVSAAAAAAVRTSTADSRPVRRDVPRRYMFLENALMAREMDRL